MRQVRMLGRWDPHMPFHEMEGCSCQSHACICACEELSESFNSAELEWAAPGPQIGTLPPEQESWVTPATAATCVSCLRITVQQAPGTIHLAILCQLYFHGAVNRVHSCLTAVNRIST